MVPKNRKVVTPNTFLHKSCELISLLAESPALQMTRKRYIGVQATAATIVARMAAEAAPAISAVTTAGTAASAVQPLGQLGETPPQQQYRSGAAHQRRQQYRGGDQSHWQGCMFQRCGEEEHCPAECRENAPAPAPQHCPYAASSSGAHVAQYGTCPPPSWTSHDSDGHSTASSYGPPLPYDSYAPAPPMPPPPRSDGPPPPAPPLESDWSFSSGHSYALRAHYVSPGEFLSSVSSDWRTNGYSVGGSYLPSAFVGQSVGMIRLVMCG